MNYLPFIDGLRAIAIVAVVIYHATPGILSGGFAGVDLFFVVSGFVITRLIAREIDEKIFSLPMFLVRRTRRLLPAAAASLALTLLISYFVLLPVAFQNLGRSLIATMFMYSNYFFYRLSGYFSPQAFELPLLHTWSLAVEDQFYLTWPAILMVIMPRVRRNWLLPIVTTLLALSLTIAMKAVSTDPEWAFFVLPSRAWELLLGCLVALVFAAPNRVWPRMLGELVGAAGVAAVALSLVLLQDTSPMPGLVAAPLCLGVAAVIASSLRHDTTVRRILSLSPLIFIGRISYSLYLLHWPFLALATYRLERPLHLVEAIAIVALGLGVSSFSWKHIERPFREGWNHSWLEQRKFILASVVAVATLAMVGNTIKSYDGWPWRYDGRIGKLLREMSSTNPQRERCDGANRIFADNDYCNVGAGKLNGGSYDVALFGDSIADQWEPLLVQVAQQRGWAGRQVTHGGCGFFPGIELPVFKDVKRQECAQYLEQALRFIDANQGLKLAIVSAWWQSWKARLDHHSIPKTRHQPVSPAITDYAGPGFEDAVLRMIKVFRDRGIKVHIIGPTAHLNVRMDCLMRVATSRKPEFTACGVTAAQAHGALDSINDIFARAAAVDSGVTYSLPTDFMCTDGTCSPVIEDVFVYRSDGFHLNYEGGRLLSKYIRLPDTH